MPNQQLATNPDSAATQVADMITQYKHGSTLAMIAQAAGCSTSHVYQTLKKAGITRKDKGSAIGGGEVMVAAMYAEYEKGKSLEEVGKPYGLSRHSVYQMFKVRHMINGESRVLKGAEDAQQVALMIAQYKDGKTLAEVGMAFGLSGAQVHQIFKQHGISRKDKGANHGGRDALVERMLTLYTVGKTLAEIGEEVGVSRQRVHQIFKTEGISSEGRGVQARAQVRKQLIRHTTAVRIQKIWDMSLEEYEAHVAEHGSSGTQGSPMHRYIEQRRNCYRLGGTWAFTFKSWWALWQESGKWDERGVGQYVLGRVGDSNTPMSPATCKITTVSEIIKGDFFSRNR